MKQPSPTFPLSGSTIDGSAAQFEWDPVPGAPGYVLQWARDEGFSDGRREVEIAGTNVVTLFGMLPADGSEYFWRVRVSASRDAWSRPERFHAGSGGSDRYSSAGASQVRRSTPPMADRDAAPVAPGQPVSEAEAPYLTASSSTLEAVAVIVVAIATILFLLIALPSAVG